MKMNAAQIEQTLQQFQAEAIPAGHPVMSQLERLFGDHRYFLDARASISWSPSTKRRMAAGGQWWSISPIGRIGLRRTTLRLTRRR